MTAKVIYQDRADFDLVLMLKAGDEEAFRVLYNKYWATVYQHVYRILRDEDESKDVVQDVFSSLWLKRNQLVDNTNIGAYLYIQGRNRVFNLIAKQRVRRDYLNSIAQFIDKADIDAIHLLEEKELVAKVEREIDQLPPRMREIFELSRKKNLSHKEIAKLLGLSEQTVKKQVHNALKIIKPKLQGFGGITVLLFI